MFSIKQLRNLQLVGDKINVNNVKLEWGERKVNYLHYTVWITLSFIIENI